MSWKFWRTTAPAPRTRGNWYGYRYAGIRTTPNGNTHVRVTAYALPYLTMVPAFPSAWARDCSCRSTTRTAGAIRRAEDQAEPPRARRRELFSSPRFSTPILGVSPTHHPAPLHPRERLPDRPREPAQRHLQRRSDFVSQDLMVTESMGRSTTEPRSNSARPTGPSAGCGTS